MATSPALCLDPDPNITRMVNRVAKVSTPSIPNALKRKASAVVQEDDETDKARRAKIMQFMNTRTSRPTKYVHAARISPDAHNAFSAFVSSTLFKRQSKRKQIHQTAPSLNNLHRTLLLPRMCPLLRLLLSLPNSSNKLCHRQHNRKRRKKPRWHSTSKTLPFHRHLPPSNSSLRRI